MRSFFTILLGILLSVPSLQAERVLRDRQAWEAIPGTDVIRYKDFSSIPAYIHFRPEHRIGYDNWMEWVSLRYFKSNPDISFELIGTETDQLGMIHYRYRQVSQDFPLEFGIWIVHTQNGQVISMNGELFDAVPKFTPGLSESAALQAALNEVGAATYKWEVPQEEAHLKLEQNDPGATYFPTGELVIINSDPSLRQVDLKLAWKFNIYAHDPMSRQEVFVDANSGAQLFENDLIHHADSNGVANTGYSGTQNIVADFTGSEFRLRESGRGNGVQTYNLNNTDNYGTATDFTDGDNIWTTTSVDQYATDAHWGSEVTYDFYFNNFGRNSIDDNGFTLRSYLHYNTNYANAFWDGQRMTYGDGSSGTTPYTALDIAGHEVTHGLTSFTADLVYSYESGALNESFSDIFGAAIEFEALGFSNGDWLMGEDLGFIIRYMNNPNQGGDPDTYLGDDWHYAASDNGGVHTNSGVQNFWFYLLTTGGTGTNDNGDNYNVTAIGIEDAQAIAFRNLTVYLTTSSQYADARFYAIQSAIDLFGACTQQVSSTGMAWYAVGVGSPYLTTVVADFDVARTESCSAPFEVEFINMSSNATSYAWDFGDGNTSTAATPVHTYIANGTYTVSLQVTSSCGSDAKTEHSFIEVSDDIPCEVTLPTSGQATVQTSCLGTIFDNGGPSGNYQDQTDGSVTIAPCGASNVTLYFDQFVVEAGGNTCIYDYVTVYDGLSTSDPVIGKYCNSNPPPASVTSTGGAITVRMYADAGLNYSGFEISWECEAGSALPVADFSADSEQTCSGQVSFSDETVNCPEQWLWDFGDGNTSTLQNPSHTYAQNGTYTVSLTATNSMGSDDMVKTSYITVDFPDVPLGDDVEICPGQSAVLVASGAGINRWYDDIFATTPLSEGDTFVTPLLNASTSYFVETAVPGTQQSAGPADNTFGSGSFLGFNQFLYFDALSSFELISVRMYATGAGDRTIELRDSDGNTLEQTTVTMAAGEQIVLLNYPIEPGTDYELGIAQGSMVNLYRNDGGVSYPYEIDGVVSITRSSAGTDPYAYYYWFYDWQVRDFCVSDREEVIATTGECLGVEELAASRVSVFPNPNDGSFSIRWKDLQVASIDIVNAQGQQVSSYSQIAQGTEVLNAELPAGLYFVKLATDHAMVTKRVVVQ